MSYISRGGAGSLKASPTRSYMAVRTYNNDIFSYTVSTDNISRMRVNYVTTGVLGPVPGATAANCTQGQLLIETGKKLYPGANPGISTYMVGVANYTNGLHGYIDPNSSAFIVQNSDRPYHITSPGTSPTAGLTGSYPDRGSPVYTRGVIYGQSDLDISGNAHIYGNLIVESTFTTRFFTPTFTRFDILYANTVSTANNLYVANSTFLQGPTILSNSLNVYSNARFHSNVNINSSLTAYNITANNSITAGANANIAGTLTVGSPATLNNSLTVYGNALFYSTMTVMSTLTAPYITGIQTLTATGPVTLGDTLTVTGATTLNNGLTLYGDTTLYGNATIMSTLTSYNNITTNNANIGGSLTVDVNLTVGGLATVSSLTTGNATLANDLHVSSMVVTTGNMQLPSKMIGVNTLVNGSVDIVTPVYVAGAYVFLTYMGPLTADIGVLSFQNNSSGSFKIVSSNPNDNNKVQWMVINISIPGFNATPLYGSLRFNGTTQYLGLTPGVVLGSRAFTVECWFYNDSGSALIELNGTLLGTTNVYGASIFLSGINNVTLEHLDGNNNKVDITYTVNNIGQNQWHHFVLTRNTTLIESVFIDGVKATAAIGGTNVSGGQQTDANDYCGYTNWVGHHYNGYWSGYFTNFRIVAGSSLYDPTAASIVVPTSPLTVVPNIKYLMLAQDVTTDTANVQTVTNYGGVIQDSTKKPF